MLPNWEHFVYLNLLTMRVIAVKTLKQYAGLKREAKQSLFAWYEEACKASWKNHNELKAMIGNASVIGDKRVVFNIHGNKYRLIVDIEYRMQIIFIVWVGTHKEYDKINAKTIAYGKTN
ncbi:MAG: type II toxin-antitoxin system HigB family toxin [Bacteroidota bacterium]